MTGPQWGECNARQTYEPKTVGHQPAKLTGESNPTQNKNSYNKLLTDTILTKIYFTKYVPDESYVRAEGFKLNEVVRSYPTSRLNLIIYETVVAMCVWRKISLL